MCIPWKKYTLIFSVSTSTVLAFLVAFPLFLPYFMSKKSQNRPKTGPQVDSVYLCILVYTLALQIRRQAAAASVVHNDYAHLTDYFWLSDLKKGPKYTQVYTTHFLAFSIPYSTLF